MKFVADCRRERRAEHRNRRGEDDPRAIAAARGADRFEQRARAVEIDPHALLEIEFGLAGNNAGQMKDHVRPAGDGRVHGRRIGDIGGGGLHFAGKFFGPLRSDDVDQRQLLDRPAVKRAIGDEARDELAPDHPRSAGYQNVHFRLPNLSCSAKAEHPVFIATL